MGADATVYRKIRPFTGSLGKVWSVLGGALATGNATLTVKINGNATSNTTITIAQSGSAAGDIDSANGSGANTVAAGDEVSITVGGTNTAAVGATVTIEVYY